MTPLRILGIVIFLFGSVVLLIAIVANSGAATAPPHSATSPATPAMPPPATVIDPSSISSTLKKDLGPGCEQKPVAVAIGLSDGKLNSDPIRAKAERECALEVLNHFLVSGDHVSLFGFGMALDDGGLWDLSVNDKTRKDLAAQLPQLTPGPGGFRFETAVRSALPHMDSGHHQNNMAFVLISSNDSDQDPPIGAGQTVAPAPKSEDLTAFLKPYGLIREQPFPISYNDPKADGGSPAESSRDIYVTLIVPEQFGAISGESLDKPRSDLLSGAPMVADSIPGDSSGGNIPASSGDGGKSGGSGSSGGIVFFGLLLMVAGILVVVRAEGPATIMISITGPSQSVGNQTFRLNVRNRAPVCFLIGENAPPSDAAPNFKIHAQPSIELAQIVKDGAGIVIESPFDITDAYGSTQKELPIKYSKQPQACSMAGKAPSTPGGAPVSVTLELEVSFK